MLARAAARHARSLSVPRSAQTPADLIRQMLTESAVLAVCREAWALLAGGHEPGAALNSLCRPIAPRLANLALRGEVLLFALGISILTGILSGLVPALQPARETCKALCA